MFKNRNKAAISILTAVTLAMACVAVLTFNNGIMPTYTSNLFQGFNKTAASTPSVPGVNTSDHSPSQASGSKSVQQETANQVNQNEPLSEILKSKGITSLGSGLKIVVSKSRHTLTLVYNGMSLKSYHVELGNGGSGDKQVEGDRKTPEGTFFIGNKNIMDPPDYYLGSRWLGISYPAPEDADRGLQNGLIDQQTHDEIVSAFNNGNMPPQKTALGGEIGIHGGSIPSFGKDWTWGCIGLSNSDIEDFYSYVSIGTPVIIQK